MHVTPHGYLILPLAGRVVQVGVAPVVVDPLLSLLVHPVQLVGTALHVVPQTQQVALASTGIGLDRRGKNFQLKHMCCNLLKLYLSTRQFTDVYIYLRLSVSHLK